ncbi:hypothetical protein GCM10010972_30030 [Cellulomonas carbonis]|nr:hypothetical protein GCM10010972_30030 [Cellulomonas carbonis]
MRSGHYAVRRWETPGPPPAAPPPAGSITSGAQAFRTENLMAETYKGEFYCVKCKEKREAEGEVVVANGRKMAKGTCPVCSTKLNRILGKA